MKNLFIERQLPASVFYFIAILVVPPFWLVFLPIDSLTGLYLGVFVYLTVIAFMTIRAKKIAINPQSLKIGTAQIPISSLGAATIHVGEAIKRQVGPNLNHRAFLCFKAGLPALVEIKIEDSQDPTPYLLLSTRKPHELCSALVMAKGKS